MRLYYSCKSDFLKVFPTHEHERVNQLLESFVGPFQHFQQICVGRADSLQKVKPVVKVGNVSGPHQHASYPPDRSSDKIVLGDSGMRCTRSWDSSPEIPDVGYEAVEWRQYFLKALHYLMLRIRLDRLELGTFERDVDY